MKRLRGDFNGLFGNLLCLSHGETCWDEDGGTVQLEAGMVVTVFDNDCDETGEPDDIIATGVIERSPDWLQCGGSRWVLRIDERGICHQSDLKRDEP